MRAGAAFGQRCGIAGLHFSASVDWLPVLAPHRSKTEELTLAEARSTQRKRIEMDFPLRSLRRGERKNPDPSELVLPTSYRRQETMVLWHVFVFREMIKDDWK